MRLYKVFFDASVIFSAINSNTGGSYKLTGLSKDKKIVAITTESVVEEVEENNKKFRTGPQNIGSFIKEHSFLVREVVTESEIQAFIGIVHEKDAHVLAGAILTESDYLVTLDKKHLDNKLVRNKVPQTKILSPKSILKILRKEKVII
jgi:putative PIN family toxin of toxin-antitoxin system